MCDQNCVIRKERKALEGETQKTKACARQALVDPRPPPPPLSPPPRGRVLTRAATGGCPIIGSSDNKIESTLSGNTIPFNILVSRRKSGQKWKHNFRITSRTPADRAATRSRGEWQVPWSGGALLITRRLFTYSVQWSVPISRCLSRFGLGSRHCSSCVSFPIAAEGRDWPEGGIFRQGRAAIGQKGEYSGGSKLPPPAIGASFAMDHPPGRLAFLFSLCPLAGSNWGRF
jgi:hypothetical protein